ncbi:MAG: aminotransferase class I/II-fold pyridoxal phosphate-dependent enzyme [Mucilaginibacter sp.]
MALISSGDFIIRRLQEKQAEGTYRSLKPDNSLIDFCSNDYLGFARSAELKNKVNEEINKSARVLNGSTGSRLLSGNSNYMEETERYIASLHGCEAGLMFNSGYDANLGLFSSLPQRGDTIIMDELIHASIIDGARLSFANRFSFKHNDLVSLEEKLKLAKGNCYVAIESVYSMDGDTPPIAGIADLVKKYGASLVVDEAHAVGLYGFGQVDQHIQDKVFARVVTFGKALGCHGAIVLGTHSLREYLINFARSFIYTTAPPHHQVAAAKIAYGQLLGSTTEIEKLKGNIALFRRNIKHNVSTPLINSESAIQCLLTGSNQKTKEMALQLQSIGLDVRPILNPSVPQGGERIRICLHAFNTDEEMALLISNINKLTNGR